MNNKKKLSALVLTFLIPTFSFAQWDEAKEAVDSFKQLMFDIAPLAFIIVLLGGAIFNIGKVWGDQRDWKGFFTSLGIFVVAVSIIVGLIAYLASLRFG
jgi:hypothetical protein